ncbi:hypothetical protein [Luteimonas saliphila]|uniref:hypothetical protein n=1 Tax=Luteimonas saliphila TaxID=2804919 RepID=UPI00192DF3B2|nr:hypothetical protein [Luteimonas saliphila]
MNTILFTLLLLVAVFAAVFFFKFSKKGTVPLAVAWKSYTGWLSAVGLVLGAYIVDLLRYVASFWEPFQSQFGELLAADSAGQALQIVSAIFFVLRMKGQGAPELRLPPIPRSS